MKIATAIAALVSVGLLVAISGCNSEVAAKDAAADKATVATYKKAADTDKENLMLVASAVDKFVKDSGGCIPATAVDLFQPSALRIAALGCKASVVQKVKKQYLEQSFFQNAARFVFVKRWDGLYVIETEAHAQFGFQKIQCTVLDARNWKCPQFD